MKKSNLLSLLGVFALILTGCQTPVESPSSNEQSVPSSEQENSTQSEVSSENKERSSSVEESSPSEENSPSEDPAALLEQYKEAKVAEVSAYVSLENYRADEQTLITEALNTAKVFIGSEAEVDEVVASYKAAVGSLKTNQQYEEEYQLQLNAAKETAKTSINNVAYDELNYYMEDADAIFAAKQLAISNIEAATSIEELTTIVTNYESTVSSTLTKEQYKQQNPVKTDKHTGKEKNHRFFAKLFN